jgi:hypothetical protein
MWARIFAIDYRSLRLFRALLGVVIVADAFYRLPLVEAIYSDNGVFPRYLLQKVGTSANRVTLLALSGEWWPAAALVTLMAILGVLLFFSIRPRTVALGLLIIEISMCNRNPWFQYGVDYLIRCMLFWSLFLPAKPERGEKTFANIASAAAIIQVAIIYLCAGWLKGTADWFWYPNAAYSALSNHFYAAQPGEWLSQYHTFLQAATISVFLLERFAWLLFFSPWRTGQCRFIGVFLLTGMHLAFGVLMDVNLFPLADITFLALLLPSEAWDKLYPFTETTPHPVWRRRPLVTEVLTGIFLVLLGWSSLADLAPSHQWPRLVRGALKLSGLNQSWGMFAPFPMTDSGWVITVGTEFNGRSVDPLRLSDAPAELEPTGSFSRSVPHRRWVDYIMNVARRNRQGIQKLYADFLCRQWNREKKDNLRRVDIYYYSWSHRTPESSRPPFRRLVVSRECFKHFEFTDPIPFSPDDASL